MTERFLEAEGVPISELLKTRYTSYSEAEIAEYGCTLNEVRDLCVTFAVWLFNRIRFCQETSIIPDDLLSMPYIRLKPDLKTSPEKYKARLEKSDRRYIAFSRKVREVPLSTFLDDFCGAIKKFLLGRHPFYLMIMEDEIMWEESYYIISSFAETMDLIPDESLKSDSTEWLYGHCRMFSDYAEDLIIPDCHLYSVLVPVRASGGSFSSYRDSMTQMYVIRIVISLLESVIEAVEENPSRR